MELQKTAISFIDIAILGRGKNEGWNCDGLTTLYQKSKANTSLRRCQAKNFINFMELPSTTKVDKSNKSLRRFQAKTFSKAKSIYVGSIVSANLQNPGNCCWRDYVHFGITGVC